MDVGETTKHGQILVRKTSERSETHPRARIWIMRCGRCSHGYECNSTNAHNRNCPECGGGRPGDDIKH